MYEANPVKSDRNLAKHGVAFDKAVGFDWASAIEARDVRFPYVDVRTVAAGFIGTRLHVMVFTRRSTTIRIISLRKANSREIGRYAEFHR